MSLFVWLWVWPHPGRKHPVSHILFSLWIYCNVPVPESSFLFLPPLTSTWHRRSILSSLLSVWLHCVGLLRRLCPWSLWKRPPGWHQNLGRLASDRQVSLCGSVKALSMVWHDVEPIEVLEAWPIPNTAHHTVSRIRRVTLQINHLNTGFNRRKHKALVS